MRKIYDCEKEGCPLYSLCQRAHVELIGTIHGGRYGIDSYTDCNHYKRCFNVDDKYGCIYKSVDEEWSWLDDEYYYDDEEVDDNDIF